ncbi:MAG: hypothetical protein A2W52_04930 [Candidatus Taylorbacteria bacterium RIFCSPHIGHO2_02_49_25]|uniref:Uncharacterized protein n=1 Tax=Candidatus Taylorbacteria bacterium RIFCSPHIGHO2_02_49_25 TaxID=1802305 RepID=A0A1G2MCM8_9BACT|nr:MAG: hypothetical protein A2759_01755 [Candidatus Taylorbacteria bacterium RIFCSPHIGHO2_01_FULL_49_60]OHA20889.1 MAG: hypothetical protein A2W52_04930 [Candidatus Taylorbacteria bacterium RIFCSPHIGHO2_02_49_25]OHA37373.1 MAG: hypothetical protein A2W65_04060 [Candidatus Taylorbacteria bacterium RIFCSPLOWO2_02_50_13]OHA41142.1 MAG: hypothetical protein A3H73_00590 [Candidatus Taylorbacteria bacterium RIFCSPLOWO2_02_FULL_50_120]OHA48027.1 MAG: hypothetical protein A3G61_02340 [Candidatus Taylo
MLFSSRSNRATLPTLLKKVDVCFLAIPTDVEGIIVQKYILETIANGKPGASLALSDGLWLQ